MFQRSVALSFVVQHHTHSSEARARFHFCKSKSRVAFNLLKVRLCPGDIAATKNAITFATRFSNNVKYLGRFLSHDVLYGFYTQSWQSCIMHIYIYSRWIRRDCIDKVNAVNDVERNPSFIGGPRIIVLIWKLLWKMSGKFWCNSHCGASVWIGISYLRNYFSRNSSVFLKRMFGIISAK